eukprot:131158-Chlamydomonas_euryale.AAC.3
MFHAASLNFDGTRWCKSVSADDHQVRCLWGISLPSVPNWTENHQKQRRAIMLLMASRQAALTGARSSQSRAVRGEACLVIMLPALHRAHHEAGLT